jgi:hypothetical protein
MEKPSLLQGLDVLGGFAKDNIQLVPSGTFLPFKFGRTVSHHEKIQVICDSIVDAIEKVCTFL